MMITTTKDLKKLCQEWQKEPFITVDTEFLREKTYYAKVCLIQIGSEKGAWCVDPLAEDIDLSPLFEVLTNKKVLKVFHACFQDMEIFYHLMHAVPTPIFDTQIAAQMCGFMHQVSYADLVESLTGEHVDKGMRFTDWSERPLTPKQQEYALGDVTHLRGVYKILKEKLTKMGRLAWLEDEWGHFEDPALYQIDPKDVWKKHRPPTKKPALIGVYAHLMAWREALAQHLNKPRKQILSDEVLEALVLGHPKTLEDLKLLRGLGGLKSAYQQEVLEVIHQGLQAGENGFEVTEVSLSPVQKNLAHLLGVLLGCQAEKVGIAESLIADKEDLKKMILNPESYRLQGWRQDVFGKKALAFMSGRLSLSWNPEQQECQFNLKGKDAP